MIGKPSAAAGAGAAPVVLPGTTAAPVPHNRVAPAVPSHAAHEHVPAGRREEPPAAESEREVNT